MGNHTCEKFPQENYTGQNTLHSNCRLSESGMALEEEEEDIFIASSRGQPN